MKYNPQIHHRRSIRLKGYDYSREGLYFITICCHNRECLFGEIYENFDLINSKQQMVLNDAGKIANECWLQIPEHFPNVILHEHIIMPNHIHGIIELNGSLDAGIQNVGVQNFEPLPPPPPLPQQQNAFQKIIPRSIGSIIRGYKIGVTKWFRKNTDLQTVWQRNYYENIIRNEQSYQTIAEYIITNPEKWKEDKFFK
ncbi:MAG: transposase [Bacteroidia bacterium]